MVRTSFVLASAAAALLALPGRAGACEPPACTTAYFAPGEGESWPVGAWPVYRPAGSLNEDPDLSTLELYDPSGVPVAFDPVPDPLFPRLYTIRPARDGVGTWRVRFPTGDCVPGPIREVSFERLAEPVGSPPVGLVETYLPVREPYVVPSAAGMCVETIDAGVVRLEVTVEDELEPLLGLASFELVVNGVTWARTLYGDALNEPASQQPGGRLVSEVFTACEEGIGVVDLGLPPGSYGGELRMTLPGTDSARFPPARFDFSIECPEDGAGGAGGGGGTGGLGGQGGTADVVVDTFPSDGADAGGCGCSTPGSAGSALGLLPLVGFLRRRR